MHENYRGDLYFLSAQFPEVDGYNFYLDIFPDNEVSGELHTDYSHPNALYLYRDETDVETKRRLRRRIMLSDTWEDDYENYVKQNPLTLCSGLSYRGRVNKLENAQRMNALIFDLDGVGTSELLNLFLRFGRNPAALRTLPMPTYLVLSGAGLHVYYVFDEPVDLYPNIRLQTKKLKYDLTFRMWDYQATSQLKPVQYQSINQGFRMVGSTNSRYGTEVKAFRTGERVTLDYLNQYVDHKENMVDINRPFRPSKMTRAAAREAYPEWYQRVIIEGSKRQKKWNIGGQKGHNGDELYNWWLSKAAGIIGGHRYFFMMCLAIYASKCDIPKKRLKQDMQAVFELLKDVMHENKLTQDDVSSALEVYSRDFYNFTIEDIEKLSGVRIERNKRNGRKQKVHIKVISSIRDTLYPDGAWRNKDGRPSLTSVVQKYRQENPDAKPRDCIAATGLSKNTVYRWWNSENEGVS
jgi:hypothetical protein